MAPGLVFGLDRGGSCVGVGFRIAVEKQREVSDYLQEREMLNYAYDPSIRSICLTDGRRAKAITFVVRRQHPSYVENLTIEQTAYIVACASGQRGANLEYLTSTLDLLESIGIRDQNLYTINQLAQAHSNKIQNNA